MGLRGGPHQLEAQLKSTSIIAGAVLALAFFCAPAQAQTSYTLACRGGGNMTLSVAGAGAIEGRPQSILGIDFARAPQSAATPVAAGQCAWLDRPLNSAEPTRLVLDLANTTLHVALRAERPGYFAEAGHGGVGDGAPDFTHLWNAVRDARDFRVDVYNAGDGTMRITRVQR